LETDISAWIATWNTDRRPVHLDTNANKILENLTNALKEFLAQKLDYRPKAARVRDEVPALGVPGYKSGAEDR
jgi:hypothetical protein